jgi:hypothetical protein
LTSFKYTRKEENGTKINIWHWHHRNIPKVRRKRMKD